MRALIVAAIALFGFVLPANAQTSVTGPISLIRTGWFGDSFAVMLTLPAGVAFPNPNSCSIGDQGAITDSTQPGYNTYYAAALTGFAARRPVTVIVHNTLCIQNRPVIVGINLLP
jgi:hypothetical protein